MIKDDAMDYRVAKIVERLKNVGACGLVNEARDIRSLCQLFFNPQGEEFMKKVKMPSLAEFDELADEIDQYGIYVNRSNVDTGGKYSVGFVGSCYNEVKAAGCKQVYKVFLMHGAIVKVVASDYAVLKIEKLTGDCVVEIEKDSTVVLL